MISFHAFRSKDIEVITIDQADQLDRRKNSNKRWRETQTDMYSSSKRPYIYSCVPRHFQDDFRA